MHVIVVGRENSLRNPKILELRAAGFELDFADPVFLNEPQFASVGDQHLNTVLLGRKLTVGEVGCWLAHDSIRKEISEKSCHEWHIVLEDDADCKFLGDSAEMTDILSRINEVRETPVVVNLFGRSASSSNSPRRVRKLYSPFAGTVGYLANLKAMSYVNSWGVAMTADWPLHLQNARFFEVIPPMVCEIDSDSIIGFTERATSAREFYTSVPKRFFRALSLKMPLSVALRAVVLNPFLRDLQNRLGNNQ